MSIDFTTPSMITNTPRLARVPMLLMWKSMPSAFASSASPSASIVTLPNASCASAHAFIVHASLTERHAMRSTPSLRSSSYFAT
jgi:hypothetical protein